ncbi:cyclohexanone monooxygenase [Actinokineospora alba]|uniref:Cyclohexanone monooxygenase n=1 Tax=Actinokineospora alba TaxID=504798 RepID=A0A1H0M167_9PSEU|nr:NAD(P)/FAD-dependent oxidoreductase [Actinokineospora alba]TDP67544.1 cyclohexanone monooxygenase [Actinokineospora alba]SDI46029.1 cyclohexanone monooxygenase [Actinokineospora alba]SDO74094.1 cyclohexanone monooxygenase [Actinokineospora alba]
MDGQRDFEVVVIGAGASGIGAAVKLLAQGVTDFAVLEKTAGVGGTWRANTYPGCACDVPSALYSFSFAPNPEWSRAFAEQPEILDYLRRVSAEHGVDPHVRFGVELTRAQWSDGDQRWHLDTTRGRFTARILVAGAGPWNEPLIPDLPGLVDFPGEVFHSAWWDHTIDLKGKRVAVVGSGASAVQFVPHLQPEVASLHLFQRTAQWVLPKPDHAVPELEKRLLRAVPFVQRALRGFEYAAMEALGVGFRNPWILRLVQRIGLAHLRLTVRDPDLRRALTPDYTLGCKRLLFSNTYYPALTKPNVTVHPHAVEEIRGSHVVGADGVESEVDAIILGTGFRILDMPLANLVFDAEGRSLAEHWRGSPVSYLGTTVAGFSNAFLLLGPSLGTGHSSAFTILEAQLGYVNTAVRRIRELGWSSITVRPDVQRRYNNEVQGALAGTVYNTGGCSSYYLDSNGRNSFSWPWSTSRMRARLAAFDPSDYLIRSPADRPAEMT